MTKKGSCDSFELLWNLEVYFATRFQIEDFADVRTAGDIAQVVARKVPPAAPPALDCPTANAFRKLHDTLCRELHCRPEDLRPRTATRDVLASRPESRWRRINVALGLRLGPLQYDLFILALPVALASLVPPLLISISNIESPNLMALVAGLPLSVSVIWLLLYVLRPTLYWSMPRHLRTLDGFAYEMVLQDSRAKAQWTPAAIWAGVQLAVANSATHDASPRHIHRHMPLDAIPSG